MNRHLALNKLSVFVVASHTDLLFRKCISSILPALPPLGELVIVYNGIQTSKRQWVEDLNDARIRQLESLPTCVSRLRNIAFQECRGEIIYFLDDDVEIPLDLFQMALEEFQLNPELAILGGPNLTPQNSSQAQKFFGAALTSSFAAPFVYTRYLRTKNVDSVDGLNLILCNLAVRAKKIPSSLRFYEGLYPNEETLFLHRAKRRKLVIHYSEKIYVYHHRRKTLKTFLKQVQGYGFGRAKQSLIDPLSIPVPFVLTAAMLAVVVLVIGLGPSALLLYAIGSLWGWGLSSECRKLGILGFIVAPLLSLGVHLSYLSGLIKGVSLILVGSLLGKARLLRRSDLNENLNLASSQ